MFRTQFAVSDDKDDNDDDDDDDEDDDDDDDDHDNHDDDDDDDHDDDDDDDFCVVIVVHLSVIFGSIPQKVWKLGLYDFQQNLLRSLYVFVMH